MPTSNRRSFIERSIALFHGQGFRDSELLILDDGTDSVDDVVSWQSRLFSSVSRVDSRIKYWHVDKITLGAKRNWLCEHARGKYIIHWDDDDWYRQDRIRRTVEVFETMNVEACGTSTAYFHDVVNGKAWRYQYRDRGVFVVGSSLAYRRSFWERSPFPDIQLCEDTEFMRAIPSGMLYDMKDTSLCIATVHPDNVSKTRPDSQYPEWEPVDIKLVLQLMLTPALRLF